MPTHSLPVRALVNIIYLNKGSDTFALKYKNSQGVVKTISFKKTNTGSWKGDQPSEAIQLQDFLFNNSLNGGDLQLLSNQDGEDIFHMVKIDRGGSAARLDSAGSIRVYLPLIMQETISNND